MSQRTRGNRALLLLLLFLFWTRTHTANFIGYPKRKPATSAQAVSRSLWNSDISRMPLSAAESAVNI